MLKTFVYIIFFIVFIKVTLSLKERGVEVFAKSLGGTGKNALAQHFILGLNDMVGEQFTIIFFLTITVSLGVKVIHIFYKGLKKHIK
ncbi:hypothetical protein [Fulvivirga sediminis]|uniref:Uncharacterized protein n=1 Tax=Fulvivirga sediminis TaxID=2803949 RepID=A0A937F8K0_9BACT|nr:hypothetical protein [Fulvivirga sediminis]MBL3656023.1 hypothetical protein [Fulvivirga sediminis]